MSKKKVVLAFLTGGLFFFVVHLITGFELSNWQFWVIVLAGLSTKLPEALS